MTAPTAGGDPSARPLAGRTISVFGSSTIRTRESAWALAEALGEALARAGARIQNGGYGGVMEAVSRGARRGGGEVCGVTVSVFSHRPPNPSLTERVHTETLLERLGRLFEADGFVVLGGSVGTLTEFFLAWNLVMTEGDRPRPLVCLGEHWERLHDALRAQGWIVDPALWALVARAADPAEVVERLRHARPRPAGAGAPLRPTR